MATVNRVPRPGALAQVMVPPRTWVTFVQKICVPLVAEAVVDQQDAAGGVGLDDEFGEQATQVADPVAVGPVLRGGGNVRGSADPAQRPAQQADRRGRCCGGPDPGGRW
ncbi:MAG: hypothetical protein ABR506_10570 [Candidatus Krumholzibacteriia bacterium]